MIRLLDSCIRVLSEQGMRKLFIDAVKGGDEGFQSMGKQFFSHYSEESYLGRRKGLSS